LCHRKRFFELFTEVCTCEEEEGGRGGDKKKGEGHRGGLLESRRRIARGRVKWGRVRGKDEGGRNPN
jgi:hypothetical protein